MRKKNLSFNLVFTLFHLVILLSIAGCGTDLRPSTTNTVPDDLLNTPSAVENPKTNVGIDPSLAIGTDGFLRISYYDKTNGDLKFARCTNASCTAPTITKVDTAGDVGLRASLEISSDGFARISYYDATNGNLKFAHCTDADCTTPVLTTVDDQENAVATLGKDVGMGSSLVLGTDGFARISYFDQTDSTKGNLKFARCTNADCTAPILTFVGLVGRGGADTSIDIAGDGFVRISHWDLASASLDYTHCGNADCTTPTNTPLDTGGTLGLGSRSSIVIAKDGFARISYVGEETVNGAVQGFVKYVQCTNDACTTKMIEKIGPTLFGTKTSIGIAPDGFARISYYDGKNSDLNSDGLPLNNGVLKFVQCTNLSCTNRTITTINDTPGVSTPDSNSGEFPSMFIGTDGFAKIAYFHRTNGDLKLAQCTNSDCTTVSITTIDR